MRVFLYGEPVNMRLSCDGLYAQARHRMQEDPLSGHLFAFINRRATQIKVLYFDRSGLCVWANNDLQFATHLATDSEQTMKDTQILSCPAAPAGVIDGSRADVSFIAGMMLDKFAFHLPLYRQHQRLGDAGIDVSRPWLTPVMQTAAGLLEPIHEAQLESIRASRVKAMDETPIKAGRAGPGKMKAAYFWPVYGEQEEICFLYYPSRAAKHVAQALGPAPPAGAVLQTDGYAAYAQ